MAVVIAEGAEVTNTGPEPGSETVTAIVGMIKSTDVGSLQTITLACDDVPISQTNFAAIKLKAPYKFRIVKVLSSNQAVTATASIDLFNNTTSLAVIGSVSLTTVTPTETNAFSAAGREIVNEDDQLQVRFTTNASGVVEGFNCLLVVVPLTNTVDNV